MYSQPELDYRKSGIYSLNSRPRGYVLLINIETFDGSGSKRRLGSKRDYEMLKEMWENFGYEVIEYYNLNLKDFQCAITEFAAMPEHENVDSAITFIMSHGKEDKDNPHGVLITTADDKFVSSDWIRERFSNTNCKTLIGKPKILFYQACRGALHDRGVRYGGCLDIVDPRLTLIKNNLVPVVSDLLVVYPTLPGYVSQRDEVLGAWFVQECISVFNEDSPQCDLLTMLSKVDNRVRKITEFRYPGSLFQVVYYESWGFNKKIYFYPKKKKV